MVKIKDKEIMALGIRRSKRLCTKKKSQPVQEEAKHNVELPEEVQENILARLTLPDLASSLPCLSKLWHTQMFPESSFRKSLDQKHPKMIAIVRMESQFQLKVAAFDFASGQWHFRVLRHLLDTDEHRKFISEPVKRACFAHHAGLLCFVISSRRKSCPIVVCNILTNEWKAIPYQDGKKRDPVLVQLAVDDTTCHYKVTVVSEYFMRGDLYVVAEVYDSATKLWSTKTDGIVYGWELYNKYQNGRSSYQLTQSYNCGSGERSYKKCLMHSSSLDPKQWSVTGFLTSRDGKSRYFSMMQEHAEDTMYMISEYFEGRYGRMIDSYKSSLPLSISAGPNNVTLMDTDRFLLLVVDQFNQWERKHDGQQTITVREQETREWHEIPALPKEFTMMSKCSHKPFMCELRWNAIP